MAETDPALVGMESCGCVTYVTARPDDLDRWDQTAIGRIIRDGGQVLRMTVAEARNLPNFFPSGCPHDPPGWAYQAPEDPADKVTVTRRNYVGAANVYRGGRRVGSVRRQDQRSGPWFATTGWFNRREIGGAHDGSDARDNPVEVLGPFRRRGDAVDQLLKVEVS